LFLKHHPQKVDFSGAFILNNYVQIRAGVSKCGSQLETLLRGPTQ